MAANPSEVDGEIEVDTSSASWSPWRGTRSNLDNCNMSRAQLCFCRSRGPMWVWEGCFAV
jgi:hypothetical protein